MTKTLEGAAPIEPEAYTEEYYRTSVEGFERFAASGGRDLSPRMARSLAIASPRAGQRVLDIACGRGEMVLQSALRGAYSVGIDYAAGAINVASGTVGSVSAVAELARMDATRLAFQPKSFDTVFMLDFVEHVHQADLEAVLAQVRESLKPGGRLVIHTSPNRDFEQITYRFWVVRVHAFILWLADVARWKDPLLSETLLPTDAEPPESEHSHLHINPQSRDSLCASLRKEGYRVCAVDHWDPAQGRFFDQRLPWHTGCHVLGLHVIDFVRFLRPWSFLPPLSRWFSDHIWVVAERVE